MGDLGGITPQHAVAGFGGALASLPFLKPASRIVAVGAVIAGVMTAAFMTPAVAEILACPKLFGSALSQRAELGLAFILGLTAMSLIPLMLAVVQWVGGNISRLMEKLTGTGPPPPPSQGGPQ